MSNDRFDIYSRTVKNKMISLDDVEVVIAGAVGVPVESNVSIIRLKQVNESTVSIFTGEKIENE